MLKFLHTGSDGEALARPCLTWLEAARACMTDDGYVYAVRQIDEQDCTDDYDFVGLLGLWVKPTHHGNNTYAPEGLGRRSNFTGITSNLADLEAGEAAMLKEYEARGGCGLHPKFKNSIVELTYNENGALTHVDGVNISLIANDSDLSTEEVSNQYDPK